MGVNKRKILARRHTRPALTSQKKHKLCQKAPPACLLRQANAVLGHMCQFLDQGDFLSAQSTCRRLRTVCQQVTRDWVMPIRYDGPWPRFPPLCRSLTLGPFFDATLPKDRAALPLGIHRLVFLDHSNWRFVPPDHQDEGLVLPPTLQHLVTSQHFAFPLLPGALPDTLTSCHLGDAFNHSLGGRRLPRGLQALTLGQTFNCALADGDLPPALTSLLLGANFDGQLRLPVGLEVLRFPPRATFHQPLVAWAQPTLTGNEWQLPPQLRSLTLGTRFDQPLVAGLLPEKLQCLDLGARYTHPIRTGVLPGRLTHLEMSLCRAPFEEGALPPRLTWLHISSLECQLLPETFPPSLSVLIVSRTTTRLPQLPQHLECLHVRQTSHHPLPDLPARLRGLHLPGDFTGPLPAQLPSSLRILRLGNSYQGPLPSPLPSDLFHLEIGHSFTDPLPPLPTGLRVLQVSKAYPFVDRLDPPVGCVVLLV